jgi:hypothetical protein
MRTRPASNKDLPSSQREGVFGTAWSHMPPGQVKLHRSMLLVPGQYVPGHLPSVALTRALPGFYSPFTNPQDSPSISSSFNGVPPLRSSCVIDDFAAAGGFSLGSRAFLGTRACTQQRSSILSK